MPHSGCSALHGVNPNFKNKVSQRSVKIKIHVIFNFNYFRMFGTRKVNEVFSPRIFISKKIVTNMKLAFTNVPFRYYSACVIQKWLRLKRAITVRLAYIS